MDAWVGQDPSICFPSPTLLFRRLFSCIGKMKIKQAKKMHEKKMTREKKMSETTSKKNTREKKKQKENMLGKNCQKEMRHF